jgi:hypothetical protein
MLTSVDGKNFVRQPSWAWIAGSTYYVPHEAVGMVREDVEPEPVVTDADRIEALTAENEWLKELLRRNIDDEPCRLDHHGYCQAHYLEEDCSVAAALAALEKQPVVRKARYFNRYLTDAEVDEQVAQMRSEK